MKNDLWLSVAGQVTELRRFVIDNIEDFVPDPMLGSIRGRLAFWILIPGRILAGKTVNQDIIPAVFVEIVSECKEIIGIGVVFSERPFKAGDFLLRAVVFGAR